MGYKEIYARYRQQILAGQLKPGDRVPAIRTLASEFLPGRRSKGVQTYSYDGLPRYGTFSHLRNADVLSRVDALLSAGTLRSSGGRFPKLLVA